MSWLLAVLYGLISGLTEFLPVSSGAHQGILLRIFGGEDMGSILNVFTHAGCLAGLLFCCRQEFAGMRRATSRSNRRGSGRLTRGESQNFLTARMLRTALLPLILGALLAYRVSGVGRRLNLLALLLALHGGMMFLPLFFPRGNKDSRSVSRFDGVLLGAGAGLGMIPGFSGVGAVVSLAALRGSGTQFSLHVALLLSVPSLLLRLGQDALRLLTGGVSGFGAAVLAQGMLCFAAAAAGSLCAIPVMRFLSVKTGFSGFAYYCWGAAMFAFVLFMMI